MHNTKPKGKRKQDRLLFNLSKDSEKKIVYWPRLAQGGELLKRFKPKKTKNQKNRGREKILFNQKIPKGFLVY